MTTEKNTTAQEMRQDVLNRLDASRKAILELSDDELESIAGGAGKVPNSNAGAITQGGSDLDSRYEIRPKGAAPSATSFPFLHRTGGLTMGGLTKAHTAAGAGEDH